MPADVQVGHRRGCDKACVNPAHLFLGTGKQVQENRAGPQRNNRCGVRGVYWWGARRRWVAQVKHNGRNHYAGVYRTLAEAEAAARAKRLELHTHNVADRVPAA